MSTSGHTDLKTDESNLVVCLRIRPMMEDEIYCGATPAAHRVDDNMVVILDPADDADDILRQNRSRQKQYIFDVVLDATSTQEETYQKSCMFLIPSIINGFNATVFAYGATGAGKTHTMLGKDSQPGIMAQSLTDLFHKMSQQQDSSLYSVTMSYLEIYNEMIRDLLNPTSGYLDLREDHSNGLQVAGLSSHDVTNTHEVMDILKEGNKQRTQEPTAANLTSSRSHAVLIISVRQRNRLGGTGLQQQYRVGKLILIDLAGSERAANTQNRGKRMVEGAHINRSLLALGNCINALSDKSGSKYVNYRDSKLTRLLKDALGGNCKTVMIAHISPASFHFEETRNTLTYADRAKNIKTKVRQNVLDMTLHIAQYSSVITDLKDEIKKLKQRLDERGSNRNMLTMQAIQAEVFSQKDEQHLGRLKRELEDACRNQSDLKHNLLEMNNVQSELNVEITKHQMLLNSLKRFESLGLKLDSTRSVKEGGVDGVLLPVLQEYKEGGLEKVRRELAELEVERMKTTKMKDEMEEHLKLAVSKTNKFEEELLCFPLSNQPHQKEVVNLLAKCQRLESDNMRLLKDLSRRLDDSRKRKLLMEKQMENLQLADQIIRSQKDLISDHLPPDHPNYPSHLLKLHAFYTQEVENLRSQKSTLLPAISPIHFNGGHNDYDKSSPRSSDDIHNITAPSTADHSSNHDNYNNYNNNYSDNKFNSYSHLTNNNINTNSKTHRNNKQFYYENKNNNKNNSPNNPKNNYFNARNEHIKKFSIAPDKQEQESIHSMVADMNNEVKRRTRKDVVLKKALIGKLTSSRLAYIDHNTNNNNNNNNNYNNKYSKILSPLPINTKVVADKKSKYKIAGSNNNDNNANNSLYNNNKSTSYTSYRTNTNNNTSNNTINNENSKNIIVKKSQKKLTYRRREGKKQPSQSKNLNLDMMVQGESYNIKA